MIVLTSGRFMSAGDAGGEEGRPRGWGQRGGCAGAPSRELVTPALTKSLLCLGTQHCFKIQDLGIQDLTKRCR